MEVSPHTASPIVVGLGNPGQRYDGTRHNIGFAVLDYLLEQWPGELRQGDQYALYNTQIENMAVCLLRPLMFMNRSGHALRECPESVAAGASKHLVMFDDAALPFGVIRFRPGGSAGGHNGLASVIDCLGTEAVPRLRLGIGNDPDRDLRDYVLDEFSKEEQEALGPWLKRITDGILTLLSEGMEAAMNKFNG